MRPEWCWALGLFEGEGCISDSDVRGVTLHLGMTDEDVVRRFQAVVGSGTIRLEPQSEARHKALHRWSVASRDEVRRLLTIMLETGLLGERREARARLALTRLETNRGHYSSRTATATSYTGCAIQSPAMRDAPNVAESRTGPDGGPPDVRPRVVGTGAGPEGHRRHVPPGWQGRPIGCPQVRRAHRIRHHRRSQCGCRVGHRSGCPLIDISTSEVYGSPDEENSEETMRVFRPGFRARQEYAISKLAAETMLLNRPELDVRIIRPFNVTGAGSSPTEGSSCLASPSRPCPASP